MSRLAKCVAALVAVSVRSVDAASSCCGGGESAVILDGIQADHGNESDSATDAADLLESANGKSSVNTGAAAPESDSKVSKCPFARMGNMWGKGGASSGAGERAEVEYDGKQVVALEELRRHGPRSSLGHWIAVGDDVLDVTQFLKMHPGGQEILRGNSGRRLSMKRWHAIHPRGTLEKHVARAQRREGPLRYVGKMKEREEESETDQEPWLWRKTLAREALLAVAQRIEGGEEVSTRAIVDAVETGLRATDNGSEKASAEERFFALRELLMKPLIEGKQYGDFLELVAKKQQEDAGKRKEDEASEFEATLRKRNRAYLFLLNSVTQNLTQNGKTLPTTDHDLVQKTLWAMVDPMGYDDLDGNEGYDILAAGKTGAENGKKRSIAGEYGDHMAHEKDIGLSWRIAGLVIPGWLSVCGCGKMIESATGTKWWKTPAFMFVSLMEFLLWHKFAHWDEFSKFAADKAAAKAFPGEKFWTYLASCNEMHMEHHLDRFSPKNFYGTAASFFDMYGREHVLCAEDLEELGLGRGDRLSGLGLGAEGGFGFGKLLGVSSEKRGSKTYLPKPPTMLALCDLRKSTHLSSDESVVTGEARPPLAHEWPLLLMLLMSVCAALFYKPLGFSKLAVGLIFLIVLVIATLGNAFHMSYHVRGFELEAREFYKQLRTRHYLHHRGNMKSNLAMVNNIFLDGPAGSLSRSEERTMKLTKDEVQESWSKGGGCCSVLLYFASLGSLGGHKSNVDELQASEGKNVSLRGEKTSRA